MVLKSSTPLVWLYLTVTVAVVLSAVMLRVLVRIVSPLTTAELGVVEPCNSSRSSTETRPLLINNLTALRVWALSGSFRVRPESSSSRSLPLMPSRSSS